MADSEILSLYAAHRDALIGYASSILRDRQRAEDVVQDAFARFQEAYRKEDWHNPAAYLYRIVRNLALDYQRRSRLEGELFVGDSEPILESMPHGSPSPSHRVMASEELEQVREAMSELPERTRIAVEMHRIGGYKLKEIAAHLGVSLSLAQLLVKEGILHCRKRLRRERDIG